jgi:hypothetical protein
LNPAGSFVDLARGANNSGCRLLQQSGFAIKAMLEDIAQIG